MFHGPLSPTGRWEEKCSAEMKYQSCPHVIYSTSLQWELFLTLVSFFFFSPFFLFGLTGNYNKLLWMFAKRCELDGWEPAKARRRLNAAYLVSLPLYFPRDFPPSFYCSVHNTEWQQTEERAPFQSAYRDMYLCHLIPLITRNAFSNLLCVIWPYDPGCHLK